MNEEEQEIKDELLIKLHEQFAENQNHHQAIFIQFIIALLTLFAAYAYIFIHMDISNTDKLILLKKSNEVEYFSPIVLIFVSTIVLAILSLLGGLLLTLGYSFRRDQHINKKIREKYLIDGEYERVFGSLYNPDNKNVFSFLPDFYLLFFWFIIGFQVIIFVATILRIIFLPEFEYCCMCLIMGMNGSFILLSIGLLRHYYIKYNNLKNTK